MCLLDLLIKSDDVIFHMSILKVMWDSLEFQKKPQLQRHSKVFSVVHQCKTKDNVLSPFASWDEM